MSKQVSPFASLTGAEKQIRWLEYQSIRLPYVSGDLDTEPETRTAKITPKNETVELPQPPAEIPRVMPDLRSRHSQYDAVIARLKQAELQTRRNTSQSVK